MNAFSLENVTKRYGDFALQNLTLSLPSGCIMGLVGENGAGKSTTIRLLLGMAQPDSGSLSLLGMPGSAAVSNCRDDIGVVLDEAGFPECLNARQVGSIMRRIFHAWDRGAYEGYLNRLHIPEEKPFKDFSRGMKMKLSIAVALSHDAKLLLLDEATSGLDPIVRDEVLDILLDFTRSEDHSVLLSSHIVSDLEKVCDYIAFIHEGNLMLCEEKDALREQYGLLRCAREELDALDGSAILGYRESPYGVEAIVRRSDIPDTVEVGMVNIEDLFILMSKGAKNV